MRRAMKTNSNDDSTKMPMSIQSKGFRREGGSGEIRSCATKGIATFWTGAAARAGGGVVPDIADGDSSESGGTPCGRRCLKLSAVAEGVDADVPAGTSLGRVEPTLSAGSGVSVMLSVAVDP